MVFQALLLLQLLLLLFQTLFAASPPMVRPGCPEKCGNVSLPYPFGYQKGCFKDEAYGINCNNSVNPPRVSRYNREIIGISISEGEMRFKNWVVYICYNETGLLASSVLKDSMKLGNIGSPFTFSDNTAFTAIGCNTIGLLQGSMGLEFTTGCVSFCKSRDQVSNNSCSGAGCCQTQIPKGNKRFDFRLSPYNESRKTYSSCSYAFLGEKDKFQFKAEDLEEARSKSFIERIITEVPIVIDWAIGNETCEVAKRNPDTYACGPNSDCSDKINRVGYFCHCRKGYEGNPYLLPEGCTDIDECSSPNACQGQEICSNRPGDHICLCPDGTNKDGRGGCIKEVKEFPIVKVVLGAGFGILFLFIGSIVLYLGLKKRRLMMLKEKFFKQNGGLLLQQQIASVEGVAETTKIFTIKELEAATKNFDDSRIIGKGGYGTVFKGILSNNKVVAIKKSKITDETQIEQFINEVAILSQINHRNVVKLLGCCLETEVPLLVYEYVSNGTLFYHIHGDGRANSMSWEKRLRIAAETAGALAYLHSAASIPIFHRDVKSTNILLDENYIAKVSDFGASRFIPIDKAQVTTLVQGTMGYLDPEYFHTSQLTDKSDVYSFGVVLVELLTGMLPLSFERSENERNLSMYFISLMKENRLLEILEHSIVAEDVSNQLMAVAVLAKRCLQVKGDERPTMMEVAAELEGLRRYDAHPWMGVNNEESESLLTELPTRGSHLDIAIGYHRLHDEGMSSDLDTTGYSSVHNQKMMHMDIPR